MKPICLIVWYLFFILYTATSLAGQGEIDEGKSTAMPQLPLRLDEGMESSAVRLRWVREWVLVPVKIAGKEAGWFKIGTGWDTSSIDPAVVERLGLRSLAVFGFIPQDIRERLSGNTTFVRADGLRCGGVSVVSATLKVESMASISEYAIKIHGEPISGVLGWDLLSTIPFELDLGALDLTWLAKAKQPDGAIRTPIITRGGFPFVDVTLGDGVKTSMMINTAGTDSVVQAPFLSAHHERFWAGRKIGGKPTTFYYVGADDDQLPLPDFLNHRASGRWIQLDCFGEITEVLASVHPEKDRAYGGMAIGMAMLQRRKMFFDGPRGELWTAAADCSSEQAIARQRDPVASNEALEWALFGAVRNDDAPAVRELLAAGVNRDRILGSTCPLNEAAGASCLKTAKVLLDAGASVSGLAGDASPVQVAIIADNPEMVRLLIKHGASLSQKTATGISPLAAAARYGGGEILGLVIDKVGMPKDAMERINLQIEACCGGHLAVVRKSATTADYAKLTRESSWSAFAIALEGAAAMGHRDCIDWMLDEFDDANPNYGSKIPPLLSAIIPSHPEKSGQVRLDTVKSLLKHGAKHDVSYKGVTPLLLACRHGSAEIVEALIAAGANPKVKDYQQRGTVQRAAEANQTVELLKHLLRAGADFDEIDSKSEATPLAIYAKHGNLAACEILLKSGADPNQHTLSNGGALQHALKNTNGTDQEVAAIVELLLKHGAKPMDDEVSSEVGLLILAIDGGRPDVISRLADSGVDINQSLELNGLTPLMVACAASNSNTVRRILDLGGRWNTLDRFGHNAVAHAAAAGRTANLTALMKGGAKPDVSEPGAVPPLCVAVEFEQFSSLRVLLEIGADWTAEHPETGLTALDMATARSDAAMVRELKSR